MPNPRDPDGPPRRRSKAGFETKRDALAFAADQLAAARQGTPAPGPAGGVTLAEHANAWLDGHRAAATTLADYRRKHRLHIDPTLGRVELGRIRPTTLAALYRQLETGDPATGKHPLGVNTVRKVHDLLSVMLQAAVDDGLIPTKPAQHPGAKPPRAREVKAAKPAITVWDARTLGAFLRWAEVEDPAMAVLWATVAGTGMRRSELCGLEWRDINLRDGYLHVKRALTEVKTKGQRTEYVVGPTKNGRPRRIELDDDLVQLLRAHRADTAQLSFANVAPDARVFTSTMDQIRWDALIGHAYLARKKLVDIAPHVYAPTVPNLHATPEQLAAAEDRLGHPLDPLLRELLGYANGWPQFLWDTDWLGTDDIGQGPRWQFGLELIDLYYDNYDTDHLPTRDQIYPVLVSAQLDDVMVVRKDGPITKGGHEFIWLVGEAPGERWDNAFEWWLACIELTNRGIAWYEQQAAKG